MTETETRSTDVGRGLDMARRRREELATAQDYAHQATVRFMQAALAEGWTWAKIGRALGVTDTAARRYFDRNAKGENNGTAGSGGRGGTRHRDGDDA